MKTNSTPQTDYREWLATKRAEAAERGGKPLRLIPSPGNEGFLFDGEYSNLIPPDLKLSPGEIYNAANGEIYSGCLSIKNLAGSLGVTSDKLTDEMERLGLVHRVLDYKEIEMICDPRLKKPQYFHTPMVTATAAKDGLALAILTERNRKFILITRKGQDLLTEAVVGNAPPQKTTQRRRQTILTLVNEGKSAAEIINLSGLPRSTVFRHLKELREAA